MDIRQFRKFHRTVAPFVLLPMFITVFTGVTYRLGKSWFGLSREQVHFLMVIHEGEYLGQIFEPVYVLLNGLGLLWMLITGSVMVWQNISKSLWFRRSTSSAGSHSESPSE
jgi:DMSO/TMAO reductase YedYZ heme-binding membrane subunit